VCVCVCVCVCVMLEVYALVGLSIYYLNASVYSTLMPSYVGPSGVRISLSKTYLLNWAVMQVRSDGCDSGETKDWRAK
jgi:hypothetical protein